MVSWRGFAHSTHPSFSFDGLLCTTILPVPNLQFKLESGGLLLFNVLKVRCAVWALFACANTENTVR